MLPLKLTAIKTFDQIKLSEADEATIIEIKEEAEMMERLGTPYIPPLHMCLTLN